MQSLDEQFLTLRKQYIEKRFGRLNPMQKEAAFTGKGPLLILAGAGSGKTTVLVNRVANLILFGDAYHSDEIRGTLTPQLLAELEACVAGDASPSPALAPLLGVDAVRPWNILAITFTNKAAGELKSRLALMLGEEVGGDVHASTFHSACVRILRRDADKIGFPSNFTIYDADDQQRVLKAIYKDLSLDDKFIPVRECASVIGRWKDSMASPTDAAETADNTRVQSMARVYAEYAKRCLRAAAMDFDDLIYHTVQLLRQYKEVREHYHQKFRYILVDEYQDTSMAQFYLVRLLCNADANICVVGDDDQSIYKFRGATIENILSFEQHFPGARVVRLEENYRSSGNILDAANGVIHNNRGRKGKKLWTQSGAGEKVVHYTAENEQDEARRIADIVGENARAGAKLRDHAVLYRMNAQSSPLENYFTRAGIPYKIVGGLRFNERREIKDLHAYMCIVANPQDDLRLRRIINEPSRKIGATTLDAVAEIASGLGVPMLEVVKDAAAYPALSRAAAALAGFYAIYQKLVEAAQTLPLDEFAAELPVITGYRAMLEAQGEESLTRLENIGQLVSNVKTYTDQQGLGGTLEGYLEEIALIADIDSYDENADAVVMMTMHAAKGLEFPYVFIVGLEEGIFPSERCRFEEAELEEERRLCYVGITRAKKVLYLSSAASRLLYGQTRRNAASRFVAEIDESLLDRQESPALAATKSAFGSFGMFDGGGPVRGGKNNTYLDRNYNRTPPGGGLSPSFGRSAAPRPAAGQPQNAGVRFEAGDVVEHKVFGLGTVQKVTPTANDTIVEIKFDTVGVKKTMANYAQMKKL